MLRCIKGTGAHRLLPQPFIPRLSIIAVIFVIALLSFPQNASALLTNRTIDDTLGDPETLFRPIYRPPTLGVWEGYTCATCAIQPERDLAFERTWTAATYKPIIGSMSIELSFTGIAIYVFFILANNQGPGIITKTVCNFTLDGQPAGSFSNNPTDSRFLEYNTLVFSKLNLNNAAHNLTIETTGLTEQVYVNFDYAVYTFDDTASNSTSLPADSDPNTTSRPPFKLPPAAIGGIVAGVIGVMALITAAPLLWFNRRRREEAFIPRPLSAIDESPVLVAYPSPDKPKPGAINSPARFTPFTGQVQNVGDNPYNVTVMRGTKAQPTAQYANPRSPDTPPVSRAGLTVQVSGDGRDTVLYQGTHDIFSALPTGEVLLTPKVRTQLGQAQAVGGGASTSQIPSSPGASLSRSLTTANATPEELRRARQEELRQQMGAIKRELDQIRSTVGRQTSNTNVDADLRGQIKVLREQIQFLQNQQQSAWAQGLSDELPPRYTPLPSAADRV